MIEAAARAAGVPAAELRRALMLRGDLGDGDGDRTSRRRPPACAAYRLEVGRPILPMLAQTAGSVAAALERLGAAAIEWKLDGARIQVHRERHRRGGVHAHPGRHHRARARGRRGRAARCRSTAAVLDGEAIAPGRRRHGRCRSRSPGRASPGAETSPRCATRCRCRRSSSTCCTWTAPTCSTGPASERFAALARGGAGARRAAAGRAGPGGGRGVRGRCDRARARGRDGEGARTGRTRRAGAAPAG